MGAHGTFESALAGVKAFNEPASRKEDRGTHKRKQDKKVKEKKGKKEKFDRPESHKHKRRKKETKSSDLELSEEEDSLADQLQRGRATARLARDILVAHPGIKKDFRELLWRLDHEEAVEISAIPNGGLRQQLAELFSHLQLHRTKQGVYTRRQGGAKALQLLGPVLEESPAQLACRQAAEASAAAAALIKHSSKAPEASVSPSAAENGLHLKDETAAQIEKRQDKFQAEAGPTLKEESAEETGMEGMAVMKEEQQNGEAGRPKVGPAMPPQALLEAAADVAHAMAAEEEALASEDLIGPPPPELVEELDGVGGDARVAEIARICRLLDGRREGDAERDAYEVVGVAEDASAGEVKKRYWRLSLLIHPDKCDHPRAQDAFNAMSGAAKALQDAGRRAEVDAAREKAGEAEALREYVRQAEVERQWRVARGEATAEDLSGPVRSESAGREEWLTALPVERRPTGPSQTSQTMFAQRGGPSGSGDAGYWGDTPQQKLLRLQAASAVAQLPSTLSEQANEEQARAAASAVDAYNQANRGQSLVEKHKQLQKEKERAAKKGKKRRQEAGAQQAGAEKEAWEGAHPWRPFDRERDLGASLRLASREDLLKQTGSLTGRFSGGDAAQKRTFL